MFSQSELAELDAELAPEVDEAAMASAQTPPQSMPPSLDELVDSAFSDEETAERRPAVLASIDETSGFDGFVEAEPATTGEILAAMAEQPISSAPALDDSSREPGILLSASAGEVSGSAATPTPDEQELPSILFEDSPFIEGDTAAPVDPAEIVPQLAALAAAIDTRKQSGLPVADTVLSSSPPPTDDSLPVAVVTAGGGSLPNMRAPALVALTHAVAEGHEVAHPQADSARAAQTAAAAGRPSGNTPVMALDDNEFQLVEDSEEHPAPPVSSIADSDSVEELVAITGEEGDADPAVTHAVTDEIAPASVRTPPNDSHIDAAWSAVVDADDTSTASSTVEDLTPIENGHHAETQAATDEGDIDLPLSSRITPVLGVPVVNPGNAHALAPNESTSLTEPTGPVVVAKAVADPATDMEAKGVGPDPGGAARTSATSDSLLPSMAASPGEASKVSPAREAGPPHLQNPPRRTAPSGAPPPPPPPAALAPQLKPASPAAPPPVPISAAAPPPPPANTTRATSPAATAPAPPPGGYNFGEETKLRKKRRSKQWFEEIFDEDYLHTLPFMTPHQTEREVAFLLETLELPPTGRVLDIGCGYGRHAMEMAARGYRTVGLDLSLPLLIRATDATRRVGVNVDFVHGDMRDMSFDSEFDGAYCFFTTFGYFDDDTNRRVASGICRALKPGGRFILELINRDYLIGDLPTRVWWQGDGCVVLEEVDFNYFTSRLQVQRQIILENGRQLEQEISIRVYSLHEIGKVLHHAGFRVLEVSGSLDLRGRFYGNESRQLVVVAERRANET